MGKQSVSSNNLHQQQLLLLDGVDYSAVNRTINIPVGTQNVTVLFDIFPDDIFESVEHFTCTLHAISDSRIRLSQAGTTVQITDQNGKESFPTSLQTYSPF